MERETSQLGALVMSERKSKDEFVAETQKVNKKKQIIIPKKNSHLFFFYFFFSNFLVVSRISKGS